MSYSSSTQNLCRNRGVQYLIFSRLVRGGAAACLKGVTLDGLSLSPVSLSAAGCPSTDNEDSLSLVRALWFIVCNQIFNNCLFHFRFLSCQKYPAVRNLRALTLPVQAFNCHNSAGAGFKS